MTSGSADIAAMASRSLSRKARRSSRSVSSSGTSGIRHGLADLGEARVGGEDLRLIVDEVTDDDVGVAHRGEGAELSRHAIDGPVDGRLGWKASIARSHAGARRRLGLGVRLPDIDIASE